MQKNIKTHKYILPGAIVVAMTLFSVLPGQISLSAVETKLENDYPVAQIAAEDACLRLSGPDSARMLLFDVREIEEYATSHLAGAIQVQPGLSADSFFAAYGSRLQGRDLLFYCSVGKRSSILAERVSGRAAAFGADRILNLRGGIFRWYNSGYPVYSDSTEVEVVHPFNAWWGQLLQKR